MMGQRLRRWPSIKTTSGECLVFPQAWTGVGLQERVCLRCDDRSGSHCSGCWLPAVSGLRGEAGLGTSHLSQRAERPPARRQPRLMDGPAVLGRLSAAVCTAPHIKEALARLAPRKHPHLSRGPARRPGNPAKTPVPPAPSRGNRSETLFHRPCSFNT